MALADIRSEIPRTIFHVLGGLFLAWAGYFPAQPLNRYILTFVFGTAVALEGARLLIPFVNSRVKVLIGPFMRPGEERGITGAPAFTGGVLLAFLLFPRPVALAAMIPLVFGDRAGLLVGKSLGRVRIGDKTLEGCLACFTVSLVIYLILSGIWPEVFDYPWTVLVGASIIGTLAEALPRPLDDNMTIPLAVGVFLLLAA